MPRGAQTNYRVKATKISKKARFYDKEKLLELYLHKCGMVDVLAGACRITKPSFGGLVTWKIAIKEGKVLVTNNTKRYQ